MARHPRLVRPAALLTLAALVLAACGGKDDPEPGPSASPTPSSSGSPTTSATPSETPSASPTESPGPIPDQVFDVARLPRGDAPATAYVRLAHGPDGNPSGGVIHAPDGGTTPLPPYALTDFAPLGEQWVVAMYDPASDSESVYVLADNGDYDRSWATSGGLGVSPRGGVVAWTGTDGTVYTAHATDGEVLTMPAIPVAGPYRTIGVTTEDCKEGRSNAAGCTVFVNTQRPPRAYATTSHGIVDVVPGLRGADTSARRWVGGIRRISDDGSCSRMLRDARRFWATCDNTLGPISPDVRTLVGLPAYLDGFGPTELDLLSLADGTPVASWTSSGRSATYFDTTWEDAGHLLVTTFQRNRWAIVRLGLDGSMEYAVGPVRAPDLRMQFRLPRD